MDLDINWIGVLAGAVIGFVAGLLTALSWVNRRSNSAGDEQPAESPQAAVSSGDLLAYHPDMAELLANMRARSARLRPGGMA